MRNPLIYLAIAALLAGCRGGSGSLQRKEQENYDVVQEGQTSSVTSTINAPGEPVGVPRPRTTTPPPAPPRTDTAPPPAQTNTQPPTTTTTTGV